MKKFQFKLSSVEKLRERNERDALKRLALAQQKHQDEIQNLKNLTEELDRALLTRSELANVQAKSTDYGIQENFITGLKQKIQQAHYRIERAQKDVEKLMRLYLFERRKRQMISTLREKDFEQFKLERKRWEQNQTDEINVMRFRLKSGESS